MEGAKQGRWIPVVRQRGGHQRGQRRGVFEGRTSFFTVFVDNIPRSVNPKGLYNIFSKFGVMNDVFIPQKRRKLTNMRFGFVRFDCPVAATVAVQRANGLWVDDTAIEVKRAAFGKEKEGRSRVGVSTVQKSYAEAVVGQNNAQNDSLTLKAEEIGNRWLYESVVVHLKDEHANVNLKKELQGIGVEDVLIRESGGRDVVLTFKSKEEKVLKMQPIKELILE
ncbi:polyadenylate-binding protein 5-like [Camellia sinensis]|uniref:polyadenylate-binding protein 5-like n=1 Tax=Camellia sinensis TaxID=4442 RepID=UPI0010360736|nr:polyadenylate-binding protein 5-like [Camellia sinensis]